MKTIITALCLSTCLVFIGAGMQQDTPWKAPKEADAWKNPFKGDAKAEARGKKIFEKLCWSCHGLGGEGDGPAAGALHPKPKNLTSTGVQQQTDGALFWKIKQGRGYMVSYEATLSANDRWKVVAYLRKLAKQ